jgi:cytoskeleton protein RodZ
MNAHEADLNEPQRAGERLAAGRERLGLSQAKVAEQLRLSTEVIAALEAGNYKPIGAQVFVRGYLRRYAELIGESPESFAGASHQHGWGDPAADITSTRLRPLVGTTHRRSIGPWPVLGVALLLCVIAVVWWAQRAAAPRAARARDQAVVQQEIVVAPPMLDAAGNPAAVANGEGAPATAAAAPAPAPAAVVVPPAASTPPAVTKPVVAKPAVPAPPPTSKPAAVTVAPPPAPAPAPASKPVPAPAATAGGGHRQIRLAFSSETWAEVYDAEGTRLYWDLAQPGQTRVLTGVPPFKFILGNPASVSLSYEGKALVLPPPRFGTTLHATLDATGALVAGR